MPPMISQRRPDGLRPPSATGACAGSGAIAGSDGGVVAASEPSASVIDTLPGLKWAFPAPRLTQNPRRVNSDCGYVACQPEHSRLGWTSEEATRVERPLVPVREPDPIVQ